MTRSLRPSFRTCIAALAGIVTGAVFALTNSAAGAPHTRAGFAVPTATDSSAVAELQREAVALVPLMKSSLARRFLQATAALPHIEPRTMLHDSARTMLPSLNAMWTS